jgi:hypothetical protein
MSIRIGTAIIAPDEAPADGGTYARKDAAWIDIEEAANLQVRRGTAAEVAAITPLDGEPVWATDTKQLFVGDGVTQGGKAVGRRVELTTPFPADPIVVTSESYATPLSVALSGSGSIWRVFGSMGFISSSNGVELTIDLSGSGETVAKGTALVRSPSGTATYFHFDNETTVALEEFEFLYVEIDYIVELSSANVNFGIPVKINDDELTLYIADGEEGRRSRLFAERLV